MQIINWTRQPNSKLALFTKQIDSHSTLSLLRQWPVD